MPAITFKPELGILAIDPARVCGFAHSNGCSGTWDLGTTNRNERLRKLIHEAAGAWGIKLIAAEDAGYGGVNRNTQAMHNELRGIIKLAASELRLPEPVLYHPTTIKARGVGKGNASKEQVKRAVESLTGIKPRDDNEADAIAILIVCESGYRPEKKARKPRKAAKGKGISQQTFLK